MVNSASVWCPQAAKGDRKPQILHPKEQDTYLFISFIIHLLTLGSSSLVHSVELRALWHAGELSHVSKGSSWPDELPCKLTSSGLPELPHPSQPPPAACAHTARPIDTAAVWGPSSSLRSIPTAAPRSAQAQQRCCQHCSAQGTQEPILCSDRPHRVSCPSLPLYVALPS